MHMDEEKNTEQDQKEETTQPIRSEEVKTETSETESIQTEKDPSPSADPEEKKAASTEIQDVRKPEENSSSQKTGSSTASGGTVPPVNNPEPQKKPQKSHKGMGKAVLKYVLIFLVAACGTFAGTYTAIRVNRKQEEKEITNQFRNFSQIPFGNDNGDSENQSSGPALGITIQQTDDGIEIVGFAKNSNAESAGLKTGDIITEVDGKSYDSVTEISSYISSKKVGDKVKVTVKRNNEEKTYSVKLVKKDLSAYSVPAQPDEDNGNSDSGSSVPKALPGTDGENSGLQG